MQVKKTFPTSVLFLLGFCMLVSLSACSSSSEVNSTAKESNSQKKVAINSKKTDTNKPDAEKWEHTHPSNPCTAAVAHSHVYTVKEHEHSYDCENTNDFVSNAHIHPKTSKGRKFRHVHPNGANKHTHHK